MLLMFLYQDVPKLLLLGFLKMAMDSQIVC